MNKVSRQELTTISMVNGNEEKYPAVILDGVLKEWVGIGWIDIRNATPEDYEYYPTVAEQREK